MKTNFKKLIEEGKLTGKVLLTLDDPGKIITENDEIAEEFYYAVIADSLAALDDEGSKILMFVTKEDFEQGKGVISYATPCMFENWFEYTAKLI